MRKLIFTFFVATLLLVDSINCLTEAQIKQTGKLIRRSCQTKTQAEDDELDGFRNGKFQDATESGKCYLNCALQMMKMVKRNGHVDLESIAKSIQNLPEPRREPNTSSAEKCKDAGSTLTDKCEIGLEISKCFYIQNPEQYLVP